MIETFLNSKVPDTYVCIHDYSMFRRDRKICRCRKPSCTLQHGGGGILIYAHSSLESELYSVSNSLESMWIKLHSKNSHPTFINASYVPPTSTKAYVDELTQYIITVADSIHNSFPGAPLFIAGDFNRMCLENLELACCVSSLSSPPTRGDAHLDIVLTNRPDDIEDTACFTPQVETDHRAVLVTPVKKIKPVRFPQYFRLFNSRGRKQFQLLLVNTNFDQIHSSDVNKAAELLDKLILTCFEGAFPLRKVMMSNKDPAWITPVLKWMMSRKKAAKRRGNLQKAQKLDDCIGAGKQKRHLALQGSKQWWNEIDFITHRKQDGKAIKHQAFDSDDLNEKFAERCKFAKNETRGPHPRFDTIGSSPPLLTIHEVEQILKSCKRTSPGPGEIPYFVFQDYWRLLAQHFLYVWNLSLQTGIFPQCYKRANIHAIPKVKHAKEMKQLRGVSVTSIVARLFERVVYRRWICANILIRGDPFQFAYKKHLSTVDYLLTLQYLVVGSLDDPGTDGVHVIAVDFSMAFDRVKQEIACLQYGKFIDSPFISNWLYDFTIGRTQRLAWKGKKCDYLSVERGCAQGTVCGPSIFSILTNNMTCLNSTCHLLKYSDDMSCVIPCKKNPTDKEAEHLRDEADNLCKQAEEKCLTINYEKTKQIRFCLNHKPQCGCSAMTAAFGGESKLKILGVTFQTNCLFTEHTKKLLSHLRSLLYIFKDLRLKQIPTDKVFDALIVSRIRYAISVYACDSNAMKKIDNFLEKCYQRKYSTTRFFANDILKAEDQRLMTNILTNPRHPLHPVLLAQKKTSNIKTRNNSFGYKPKTNTKLFMKTFCNRILTL